MRLDAILDAERARKISLPNDYRALLTITNGMQLWEHEFFGAGDYREPTPLARARALYRDGGELRRAGHRGLRPARELGPAERLARSTTRAAGSAAASPATC